MVRDIGEGLVHGVGREGAEPLRPHHLAAEAEAAIDRADVHGLQQHAVGIAVDDALDRRMREVADGIGALLRRDVQFRCIRHELAGDGIVRIGSVDQRGHGRADGDGIALGDGLDPGEIFRRDEAGLDELGGRADGADRVQRPVSGTGAQIT